VRWDYGVVSKTTSQLQLDRRRMGSCRTNCRNVASLPPKALRRPDRPGEWARQYSDGTLFNATCHLGGGVGPYRAACESILR
jgi:hypothetical protein